MINIPKIFKSIKLSDYAPEFGDAEIKVQVNPSKSILIERDRLVIEVGTLKESIKGCTEQSPSDEKPIEKITEEVKLLGEALRLKIGQLHDWYANIWYQDDQPMSKEDIAQIFEASLDTDPRFGVWLSDRTADLILEHRNYQKN